MMCKALSTEALVSKEKRASTSVETLPGIMLRISLPNSTRRRSRVASTCSSMFLPYTNENVSSPPKRKTHSIDPERENIHAACRIRQQHRSTWHIRAFSKPQGSEMDLWWHPVAYTCQWLGNKSASGIALLKTMNTQRSA